ncbi:MAG TPA: poly(R)-hydroxyalkanoic acid synthase subunit PhaE [Nitrososphaeraceae archaeon]|jgi:Poly(R)-hydroxyalkanoic acid synthase subunit (PHA_synth_III_E)
MVMGDTITDDNKQLQSNSESDFTKQQEQIKKIFNGWFELIKLPTIGPFQAFSKDFISYAQELFNIGQTLLQLQINLKEYHIEMNNAYLQAMKEVSRRAPKQYNNSKEDIENYRLVAIDAFENAFTELFGSKDFAVTNNKVTSSQLDLLKHMQNIAEKNFEILKLPTRSEVDEILKDIHELKKAIRDMKKNLEVLTIGTHSK